MQTTTWPSYSDLRARLAEDPAGVRFARMIVEGETPAHDLSLGPCIRWTGSFAPQTGYGFFKVGGKSVSPHRWLHEFLYEPVPKELDVHHVCHHPDHCLGGSICPHRLCVVHTAVVTRRENVLAGGSPAAKRAKQTRCQGKYAPRDPITGEILGHDLTDDDNVIWINGTRHCKTCQRESQRRYASRVRATRRRHRRRAEGVQLTLVD